MNIFVLDTNVKKAAEYHCDKHVVKMITESAQLLSNAYYYSEESKKLTPYKLSNENHPCSVWARESINNWYWLLSLGLALYDEYKYRYYNRDHKAGDILLWCYNHPPTLPVIGMTEHPLCMPEQYKSGNVVASYRAYYVGEKSDLFTWTEREVPYWIKYYKI